MAYKSKSDVSKEKIIETAVREFCEKGFQYASIRRICTDGGFSNGKRESHNIYAKTREECEEKLAEMITEVKAQIKAEKERLKAEQSA